MITTVPGENPVSFYNLRDLLSGYSAIASYGEYNVEDPTHVSRLNYELSILNNIKGEILCLVQDINKRVGYIDELTSNL